MAGARTSVARFALANIDSSGDNQSLNGGTGPSQSYGPALTIKKRILFLPVLVIWLVFVLQLRWNEVDNEFAIAMGKEAEYDGLLISGNLWRGAILVALLAFSADAIQTLKQFPRIVLLSVAMAVLSTLWSIDRATSIIVSFDIIVTLAVTALGVRYLGRQGLLRVIWYVGIAVLIISVALAALGDVHAIMGGIHAGRWRGIFHHKNVFGAFASIMLILALLAGDQIKAGWLSRAAVALLAIGALAFALSSTAIVTAAVAIGAGLVASIPVRGATNRIGLYLCFALVAIVGGTWLLTSLDTFAELLGRDITLSGRTAFWAAAVPPALAAPFGYGIGTTGGDLVLEAMQAATGLYNVRSPHSTYIQMALDLGWPATVVFSGWLFSKIIPRATTGDTSGAVLTAIAAFHFASGLTEVRLGLYPSLSFIILLGLVVSRRVTAGHAKDEALPLPARKLAAPSDAPARAAQ